MNCDSCAEHSFLKKLPLFFIRLVSSFFRMFGGRACRFYPSCSEYARRALETRGIFTALSLIVTRILRCHPFSAGGYDPVLGLSEEKS